MTVDAEEKKTEAAPGTNEEKIKALDGTDKQT